MVNCWKRLFCGMHCFIISICDVESHFNDGTNERYHLLIYHRELEQLKTFEHEKLSLLQLQEITKTSIKYWYHWVKKKRYVCYIPGVFSDIFRYITNEPSVWHSFVKNALVDDGDIQLATNRFDRNTYCTVSGGNSVSC